MDAFNATSNSNLRSIPFSRKGVKKTHQGSLFPKWLVMARMREKHSMTRPIIVEWEMKNSTFDPKWQPDENITTIDIENLLLFNYM